MALVCEQCRKVFGLNNVDVMVGSIQDPSTVPEKVGDLCVDSNDIHVTARSDESNEELYVKPEGDSDCLEHELNPKRLRLSSSPFHLTEHMSTNPTSRHHCIACLGTLDEDFVLEIATTIPITIEQEGYTGLRDFCLAIHMPLSLMIRRMGMEKYVQKQNGNQNSAYITVEGYVKEELRTKLREKLEKSLSLTYKVDSLFQIIVKLEHSQSLEECQQLVNMYPDCFKKTTKRGRSKNRKTVEEDITIVPVRRALECATVEDLSGHGYLLPAVELRCSHKIELLHKPLYIGGRYNKYSRSLPQTPWVVDGIKKAESSVQELICDQLSQLTRFSDVTFSASGREDVDVRMLGTGRPFAVELTNPRNVCLWQEDIDKVEELINKSTPLIAVRGLTQVSKEETSLIKEGEVEKKKQYCALVWSEGEITAGDLACLEGIKDLKIAQKTPIRVLHRRSLATRERTVYSMQSEVVDSHRFKLYLCCQAGTYVKEFVHSDFGRSQPSLGGLLSGREVGILSLDVTDVQLEWPPTGMEEEAKTKSMRLMNSDMVCT